MTVTGAAHSKALGTPPPQDKEQQITTFVCFPPGIQLTQSLQPDGLERHRPPVSGAEGARLISLPDAGSQW